MKAFIVLLLLGIFALLVFIAYKLVVPTPLTKEECYRLGSNERTILCLNEIESRNPEPTLPPFPLYDLNVSNVAAGNGSFYQITIKNNNNYNANHVQIKTEYMKKKNDPVFDTTYYDIGAIGGGDTVTRSVPLSNYQNIYFQATVVNAEYSK